MSNTFDNTTLNTGNELISTMEAENKRRWEETITSTDLTVNNQTVRQTISKISNDPTVPKPPCLVTVNQVAHQPLMAEERCQQSPSVLNDPQLVKMTLQWFPPPLIEKEYKRTRRHMAE